jgi:hypothetical protein
MQLKRGDSGGVTQDGRARGSGAGGGRKADPAAGEQRTAVFEQHDAVAEEAPALLGVTGDGLGRSSVTSLGVWARGTVLTRLASHLTS